MSALIDPNDIPESLHLEEKRTAVVRIVDDESATRRSLGFMLQLEGYTTRTYANAAEFLEVDDLTEPGCAILDVRMPEISGLQLQRILAERGVRLPLIFLTGYADIDVAVETMRRGAHDFLLKPVESKKLLLSIRGALHRDDLARREPGFESGYDAALDALERKALELTGREREILILFSKGLGDRQAAERLGISVRTIEGHRLRLYRRFGVHNADELGALLPAIAAALRHEAK